MFSALRADLAARVQNWRWCGLWRRLRDPPAGAGEPNPILSAWPADESADCPQTVNLPQTAAEEDAVRRSVARSRPFGSDAWLAPTAAALGLGWTLRPRGGHRKRRPDVPTA